LTRNKKRGEEKGEDGKSWKAGVKRISFILPETLKRRGDTATLFPSWEGKGRKRPLLWLPAALGKEKKKTPLFR